MSADLSDALDAHADDLVMVEIALTAGPIAVEDLTTISLCLARSRWRLEAARTEHANETTATPASAVPRASKRVPATSRRKAG